MIVKTHLNKQYNIDNGLIKRIDRMIDRVNNPKTKLDVLLIIDGYEGYGKTNMAVGLAYYVHKKTGRSFGVENLFFDAEKMLEHAIKTECQIIIWDEAALMGLSAEHYRKIQIALIKMLNVARKKRHFFIFNIPRFYNLRSAIIDRTLGLIHTYARKEVKIGRFFYYKKASFEMLYDNWKGTRKRPKYNTYKTLRGSFSETLSKTLDEPEYDRRKDEAMLQILQELEPRKSKTEINLRIRISKLCKFIVSKNLVKEAVEFTKISQDRIYKVAKLADENEQTEGT